MLINLQRRIWKSMACKNVLVKTKKIVDDIYPKNSNIITVFHLQGAPCTTCITSDPHPTHIIIFTILTLYLVHTQKFSLCVKIISTFLDLVSSLGRKILNKCIKNCNFFPVLYYDTQTLMSRCVFILSHSSLLTL